MRRLAFVGVAALAAWFVACSWVGVDFGGHWDEWPYLIRPAVNAIRAGTVLSDDLQYPSVLHDLILIAALPHLADGADAMATAVESRPFLLMMRRFVGAMTALTIVWVFLLLLVWRGSPLEALAGAAITAGSWELHYHSRWMTVDPLVVQFAALTLLCAVAGYRRGSPWLLRASAIAAALGCGSKYPAGALILPVLIACWLSPGRWRRVVEALILFPVVFLITTPGAFLTTTQFIERVRFGMHNYTTGVGLYAVSSPIEHASLLAQYIGLVLLSNTPLIAGFLALAAIVGAIVVVRDDSRVALILFSFPIVYLAFFATRKVMVVRNDLVVVPFLAPLAAIGISTLLVRGIRAPLLRRVAAAGFVVMVLVNLAWLWTAARSIRRQPRVYLAQLADYLDTHRERRFALSPRVADELRAFDGRDWLPAAPDGPGVDRVVFFALESPSLPLRPNRRDSVERWFGAYEVNFNYYPTWVTADRVLVMKPENILWLQSRKPQR